VEDGLQEGALVKCHKCKGPALASMPGSGYGNRGTYIGRCWKENDGDVVWVHCHRTPRAAYMVTQGIGGRICLRLSDTIWGSVAWDNQCVIGLW